MEKDVTLLEAVLISMQDSTFLEVVSALHRYFPETDKEALADVYTAYFEQTPKVVAQKLVETLGAQAPGHPPDSGGDLSGRRSPVHSPNQRPLKRSHSGGDALKKVDPDENLLKNLCKALTAQKPVPELRQLVRGLGKLSINDTYQGAPPLHWAVRTNEKYAKEAVNLLLAEHANVNALKNDGKHVLHTVLSFTGYDTTEVFRHLLARGAMPYHGLDELCTNVEQRYWLFRARQLPPLNDERLEKLRLMKLERMPEIFMSVIGQTLATSTLFQTVMAFRSDRQATKGQRKPLVMCFAGPPGHGKTELAKGLGRAIVSSEDEFLLIECAAFKDVMQLCGAQEPFAGGREGSKLNNFLCDKGKGGRPLVVVLDEFDKLERSAVEGLFGPFDQGLWEDRRSKGKSVDCSAVAFILTTNLADPEILREVQVMGGADHLIIPERDIDHVVKKLEAVAKRKIEIWAGETNGPAFVRRINAIIPFLPFNILERTIVADSLLRALSNKYRDPPNKDRHVGNVEVHIHPSLCKAISKDYVISEGASSLIHAIDRKAKGPISNAWFLGVFEKRKEVWLSVGPANDPDSVILLDSKPKEEWIPLRLEDIGLSELLQVSTRAAQDVAVKKHDLDMDRDVNTNGHRKDDDNDDSLEAF